MTRLPRHEIAESLPPDMALSEALAGWADEPATPSAPRALSSGPGITPLPAAGAPESSAPAALLVLHQARPHLAGTGMALGPFSLRVAAGEQVAMLGPSGAGKSTLLRLMAGELAPQAGELRLQDIPLPQWRPAALARRRAVLPQSHRVAFSLPVETVVGLGRVAQVPDAALPHILPQALALAQAGHLRQRRFDTLSGGEQARVQLARVFAQLWDAEAGLLLVDEPLAALDPGLQFELLDAMQGFCRQRGHALVAVLHDLNQALAHFDRLWLLQHGRLLADLPPDASALGPLEALYGIQLRCVAADPEAPGRLAVLPQRRQPA